MAVEAGFAVGGGVFDTPAPAVPFSDPREAPGQECEAGFVAWQARLVHDEWRRACWMVETSRARADVLERWPEGDPRVIAARLGWSVSMAAARLETAQGALERLPRLGVAMREGWLEFAKAAVFVSGLRDVTDAQAAVVVDALLSRAPTLGLFELGQRVSAAVKDVDPCGAENRRAAAVARARVSARIAPSGAAELHGLDLDPGMAVPAFERILAIAEEALSRLKAAGSGVGAAKVQAQVYLRLLHGCPDGSDDLAVLAQVIADLTPTGPGDGPDLDFPDDGPEPGNPGDGGPNDSGPNDSGPNDDGPNDSGRDDDSDDNGPDDGGPGGSGPDNGPDDGSDGDGPDGDGPDEDGGPSDGGGTGDGSGSGGGSDDGGPDGGPGDDGGRDGDGSGGDGSGGDVSVGASGRGDRVAGTGDDDRLLGAGRSDPSGHEEAPWAGGSPPDSPPGWQPGDPEPDPPPPDTPDPRTPGLDPPGELAGRVTGHGLVFPPSTLRTTLATVLGLGAAHGRLPAGAVTGWDAYRAAWARTCAPWRVLLYRPDGALEHVLLIRAPHQPGADPRYRRQVVELTAHTHEVDALEIDPLDPDAADSEHGLIGIWAELARRTKNALAAARRRPSSEHPAVTTREAGNRFPGAELTRWIHARDQTCRFPMSTVPAVACPIDHTLDHVLGGPTQADNLGPLSVGNHLRKHDPASGWTVHQTRAGTFVWTAPTGTRHTVEPDTYQPLPPVPRDRFDHGITDTRGEPRPEHPWRPRTDRHGHITDAQHDTLRDLQTRRRQRQQEPPNPFDDDPPF